MTRGWQYFSFLQSAAVTLSLVLATSIVSVGQQPIESVKCDDTLAKPRLLLAGGAPVRSADQFAAPAVGDVNGDGVVDLLVGDFGQRHGELQLPKSLQVAKNTVGAPGQVKIYLGHKVDGGVEFKPGRWATASDGKIQSPTW